MVYEPKKYEVGVTTGLHKIAKTMPTWEYKLSFGMKKGVNVLEWSSDVPHELTETQGKSLKKMAKRIRVKLLLHGALTVPLEIGDRRYYAESHDVMRRSIEVADYMKAKYVLFHASLNQWIEYVTRSEVLFRVEMSDHRGRHVEELLSENKKLSEWFIEEYGERFRDVILKPSGRRELSDFLQRLRMRRTENKISDLEYEREYEEKLKELLREDIDSWEIKESGNWRIATEILFHYMLFEEDDKENELLKNMLEVYEKELKKEKIFFDPSEKRKLELGKIKDWFEKFTNNKLGKEFFYGLVAAKYVQGHILDTEEPIKPLMKNLKKYDLILTLEIPDARDPRYAGMYNLWRPKQIYALVKTIDDPHVKMTIDFEHIATQAAEPEKEIEDFMKTCPDAGKYIISVHCTTPTPTHSHYPIRIGDEYLYKLLWMLRKTDFKKGFLIFERGSPPPQKKEPVRQSITALRLMVEELEKDTPPEKLPLEFYGMEEFKTSLSKKRQRLLVREHVLDPIKGMMFVPEERYTFLGRRATRKRKPEEWEREKYK